ncbi:helix-turn-helix domain-containing protein [Dyella sp. 20L07]|uniref:helix-turn-helix domain-containing protein n=1 Tax=Dyella sp. 20L07 TaxID=3384240 RepID=UPI003D2E2FE5
MPARARPEAADVDSKPGRALRTLRIRRGWTLAEVGERTGLPVSTLSKLENGKASLSYDKLTRLCAGLEIDIAELFATDAVAPTQVTGRRSITRAGEGKTIDTESYLHLYPASDLLNKRFVPIIAEIHARSLTEFGELIRHPGEEYAFVLEGAVELHTELYAPTRLEAGDSIYFDSGMGHAYVAVSTGRCRVLSICSASESQLIGAAVEHDRHVHAEVPKARPVKRAPAATSKAAKPVVKPKGRGRAGKS